MNGCNGVFSLINLTLLAAAHDCRAGVGAADFGYCLVNVCVTTVPPGKVITRVSVLPLMV